jgi:hypothetical protein
VVSKRDGNNKIYGIGNFHTDVHEHENAPFDFNEMYRKFLKHHLTLKKLSLESFKKLLLCYSGSQPFSARVSPSRKKKSEGTLLLILN